MRSLLVAQFDNAIVDHQLLPMQPGYEGQSRYSQRGCTEVRGGPVAMPGTPQVCGWSPFRI